MRLRTWQSALDALIVERMGSPFAWGSNDCCMFAADAVLAITGRDPAEDLRGTYSDERGARRLIQANGGLTSIAAARSGPEVAVAHARVGDVVLGVTDGRESLGICTGRGWHGPGIDGLGWQPMEKALRAWRTE